MSKLRVVITSGGTREYVDDVRVLTNISSGRLGAIIADVFIEHGQEVIYVAPKNAVSPLHVRGVDFFNVPVKDTASFMEVMKEQVPKADVVIQAMAVSDFTFDLKEAIKIDSSDPEAFIEHMRRTIVKTPKVISHFRDWNPDAILVGFKFTVGETKKDLIRIATELMEKNRLDLVFANDKVMMQKNSEHTGYLIKKAWTGNIEKQGLYSKKAIAEAIYQTVMEIR